MSSVMANAPLSGEISPETGIDLLSALKLLRARKWLLILGPLLAGAAAFGITFLFEPMFTARTVFLPPQQQSGAANALASLGPLAGLAGGVAGLKTPGDQYVALLQSANVEDRVIDRFELQKVYDQKLRVDNRRELKRNVRIELGKKDGLIVIEVDANKPQLSADIANEYVQQLRRVTTELALTEAQQRRTFFEREMKQTRAKLTDAQQALQAGGFSAGAMKAEPKTAAESYARVKAELTAAEVRLQVLRQSLTSASHEVQQQTSLVSALRGELRQAETSASAESKDANYLSRYREFKYQAALFDLFSKQYELARVDESRDGSLIQVVDLASAPERKSRPKRATIAAATTMAAFLLLLIGVLVSQQWRAGQKARFSGTTA